MNPWDQDIADVIAGRKRWAVVCANAIDVLPTIPSVDVVLTDAEYAHIARRRIADAANHLYQGVTQ